MSHKRWYTRQAVIVHQGELTPEERTQARNPSELRSFFSLNSGTDRLRDWQLEEMAAATGAPRSHLTKRNSVLTYVLRAFSNGQLVALRRTNAVASPSQSPHPSTQDGGSSGQVIEAARFVQARSTGIVVSPPRVMSSPAATTVAKARPEKQSDFVINIGQDAFVVSFELLPGATTTASVRVVVSPVDYSRACQSQLKYWDGKGREVGPDDRWKTTDTWSVPAEPFAQTIQLANRANFDPIDLKRLPEPQATVWTFDLNNDGASRTMHGSTGTKATGLHAASRMTSSAFSRTSSPRRRLGKSPSPRLQSSERSSSWVKRSPGIRFLVTSSPLGSERLLDSRFGHEAKHIKDFAAGMVTSSEALAERAGEELWALVKKKLVR